MILFLTLIRETDLIVQQFVKMYVNSTDKMYVYLYIITSNYNIQVSNNRKFPMNCSTWPNLIDQSRMSVLLSLKF